MPRGESRTLAHAQHSTSRSNSSRHHDVLHREPCGRWSGTTVAQVSIMRCVAVLILLLASNVTFAQRSTYQAPRVAGAAKVSGLRVMGLNRPRGTRMADFLKVDRNVHVERI